MSSQKGNIARSRPQKHKNRTAFKNNLHDTSNRTKMINSIQVSDVCMRCKEIIEWKIKYKKYKPLTQPKTCVKCGQKTVKKAYHVMCTECGKSTKVCTKCCQSKEAIVEAGPSEAEQLQLDNEMKNLLQSLPERKRRSFLRYMNKSREGKDSGENKSKDLKDKLMALKISEDDEDFDFDDFDSSEDDEDRDEESNSGEDG